MENNQKGFAGFLKRHWLVIVTGIVVGAAAVILTALGNPKNMGFCIACFERDIAGSLMFHKAEVVQYFRPEIVGLVLGAMCMAMIKKEWRPQGGSSPITRFILGMLVMIGGLVFLGCPLRMVIRIGGGDLNAVIGLLGFIVGIVIGTFPLRFGFTLNRAYKQNTLEGLILPIVLVVLFVLSLVTDLFAKSEKGRKELFENYAKVWCLWKEDTGVIGQLSVDEHSPERIRVNAVLSATDEFYEIYGVKEGDGMYVQPERRVHRW